MQTNELDPVFTLKLLVAAQFFMNLLIGALTIWKITKREPPLHEAYASRAEHKELVVQVVQLAKEMREGFAKMEESRRTSVSKAYQHTEKLVSDMGASIKTDLQEMRRNMRDDNDGVNQRVDTVLKAVSRLEGKVEENSIRQKKESQ